MHIDRKEYIMIGVLIEKKNIKNYNSIAFEEMLKTTKWEDPSVSFEDQSLRIVPLNKFINYGFVIGKVLLEGSYGVGVDITSLDISEISNAIETLKKDISDINEKLHSDISVDDIKCYVFSSWS